MQDVILECEEHPGETMTVWLEGFDEAGDRMTTLVANTSVRFVLRREAGGASYRGIIGPSTESALVISEAGGASYRGIIGARTYFYDPPARKARAPRKAGA